MTGSARVIRADARSLPLADDSVDLVVTSPPYFALRSYQDGGEHYDGQIGSEATPAEFVDALLDVTRECVRVLKPSGSLWVNLGDKYSGAQAQNFNGVGRAGASADTWKRTNPRRTGISNKSLMGIPWRYALACIDDLGIILRAEVVWSKPNGLPESVTDRVRRSHEQWFHFTLRPRYYSAVDEIREEHLTNGRGSDWQTRREHLVSRDGYARQDDVLGFDNAKAAHALGKLPGSVWTIPTEPLTVPDHLGVDHFAAFPTEWPRRIIAGWSPAEVCSDCEEGRRPVVHTPKAAEHVKRARFDQEDAGVASYGASSQMRLSGGPMQRWRAQNPAVLLGYECSCRDGIACERCHGTGRIFGHHKGKEQACPACSGDGLKPSSPSVVLDPFGGTGTTALVAKALGRHGISVDMSADYCRLAEWRTNDPDQLAKAMRVEKPPRQVTGQDALFDMDAPEKPRLHLNSSGAERDCPSCGYRSQYERKPGRPCEKCGERGAA